MNFSTAHVKQIATAIASACLLVSIPSSVQPAAAQLKPHPFKTPIVPEGTAPEELTAYERAQTELTEDYYILYRIVDRIARVNDLDDSPWRIAISPEYNINAFATQANLVHLYNGLLDQLAGDVSAVACVVGHEMAHHELQHIPIRNAEFHAGLEEIRNLEDEEERGQQMEAHIERMGELSRIQELEADAVGFQYAIAAGFEPEGCLRVLNVLSRLPGSLREGGSHPTTPTRIEAIDRLIADRSSGESWPIDTQQLDDEEPLTYKWLETVEQLRIDSQRGGSFREDFESIIGRNSPSDRSP